MTSAEAILEKTTLGLNLPSDPRWATLAEDSIIDILIDHAWCEQKAASTGISLIVKFGDRPKIVEVLTPIVAEEWEHFRRVIAELKKRGHELTHKRVDTYVVELMKTERAGHHIDRQLMDKLLISAMVEARSCERFKILHQTIKDKELSAFYYELMISEAGHYRCFIDLAKEFRPEAEVDARWKELLVLEAEIIKNIGVREGMMH